VLGGAGVRVGHDGGSHEPGAERLDLEPHAGLEPLERSAAERLLGDGGDLERQVGADVDQRRGLAGHGLARAHQRVRHDVRRHLDRRDDLAGTDRLAMVECEDLQGVQRVEPPEALYADVHDAVPARHEVQPALAGRLESEPRPGRGPREALRRLVLVQVARVEQRQAHRLGELAGARCRDQPAGDRRIEARPLPQWAGREPRRGQEYCTCEFVGGKCGEVGRSEAPGPHPGISRR
jgi:hypothetical protein